MSDRDDQSMNRSVNSDDTPKSPITSDVLAEKANDIMTMKVFLKGDSIV